MKHIGLMCSEVSGHLNPTTTLGRVLQRRGYRVSLLGKPDAARKTQEAGLDFVPIGAAEYPAGTIARQAEHLGTLAGPEALAYTIDISIQAARVTLREAPQVVREAQVDALIVDEFSRSCAVVAEAIGIPYITLSNALVMLAEPQVPPFFVPTLYDPSPEAIAKNVQTYRYYDQATYAYLAMLNEFREANHQSPFASLSHIVSGLAQIAQQPAFFDFPRANLPDWFHYTGPLHDERSGDVVDFPFDRLDGRPVIYASMGTLQNRLQSVFQVIAAACAGLEAQLVISLGNPNQSLPADLPGSPLVVPYAPQLQLLKRAAVVITHGGLNTVLESLTQGVPLVAIPITNDQPGVAARLAYTGTGAMIPIAELEEQRLRETVQRVLQTPSYRDKAQKAQQEIAKSPGVEGAADIAVQALSTGQPVLRPKGL